MFDVLYVMLYTFLLVILEFGIELVWQENDYECITLSYTRTHVCCVRVQAKHATSTHHTLTRGKRYML